MKLFIHSDISIFEKKRKKALLYTLIPTYSGACFSVIFVMLNIHLSNFHKVVFPLGIAMAISCVISVLASIIIAIYYENKINLHSKYSFIDIFYEGVIVSVFRYKYRQYNKKFIHRDLYFIKHSDIVKIKGKNTLKIEGKIRKYSENSDRLGYHIKRGELSFDNWWLNENGFKIIGSLTIPEVFGNTAKARKYLKLAGLRRRKILLAREQMKINQKQSPVVSRFFKKKRVIPTGSFDRRW